MAFPRSRAGHVSATRAAPLAHSPPMPSPSSTRKTARCKRRLREPAGGREHRVDQDARAERRLPAVAIGDEPEYDAARRRRRQRDRAETSGGGLVETEVRHQRRQHERVEHHVERVEAPPERGRDQGPAGVGRGLAPPSSGDHCAPRRAPAADRQTRVAATPPPAEVAATARENGDGRAGASARECPPIERDRVASVGTRCPDPARLLERVAGDVEARTWCTSTKVTA